MMNDDNSRSIGNTPLIKLNRIAGTDAAVLTWLFASGRLVLLHKRLQSQVSYHFHIESRVSSWCGQIVTRHEGIRPCHDTERQQLAKVCSFPPHSLMSLSGRMNL